MKPKPQIVVKPRVTTGRPDLDGLHTRQLMDRLGSERAKLTNFNHVFGEPSPEQKESVEVELNAIKAVLTTREHLPNKVESKQIRRDKQLSKQSR